MDRVVYDRMAAHDSTHWWYRARRDVLQSYLERYGKLPADARILEIGCGTGMILFRIAPRCEAYTGIDVSGRALRYVESQLGRVGLDDGRVRLLRKSAHEREGMIWATH